MWGHIDISISPPNQENDKEKYLIWKTKDFRTMAWIIDLLMFRLILISGPKSLLVLCQNLKENLHSKQ